MRAFVTTVLAVLLSILTVLPNSFANGVDNRRGRDRDHDRRRDRCPSIEEFASEVQGDMSRAIDLMDEGHGRRPRFPGDGNGRNGNPSDRRAEILEILNRTWRDAEQVLDNCRQRPEPTPAPPPVNGTYCHTTNSAYLSSSHIGPAPMGYVGSGSMLYSYGETAIDPRYNVTMLKVRLVVNTDTTVIKEENGTIGWFIKGYTDCP